MLVTRRLLAGVLVACAVRGASGQAAKEGWTLTMRTSSDSGGAPILKTTMRIQTYGQRIRVEMLDGAAGAASGGGYMLATAGDSTVISVAPARHTAMTMSRAIFGREVTPRFEPADVKVDRVEHLGPGERLLGHATTRYRITESWTTKISLANESCTRHVTRTAEMWIAPDIDLTGALEGVAKALGRGGPADNYANALTSVRSERMPKGTALRTVAKTSDAPGAPQRTTTTEFVELTHAAIDTTLFVVPADYSRMDQATIMASLPRGATNSGLRDIGQRAMRAMCGQGKSP
jgi:hypothetical protein